MADDIQIKTANPQGNSASAAGQQPAQPAQTSPNSGTLNPVIDLRAMDQTGAVAAPQTAVPAATTPAAAPTPPTGAPKKQSVMLGEEEDYMAQIQEKYTIPALVKEKFPDLIQLIKETESMNDEERDYWFQILPIMTEDQIKKFRDILVNEKEQLSRLDTEYEQELTKLNEKHMIEWKEFETKEKRKALTSAETVSKAQEKAEEEELLKRLSQA